MSQPGASSKPPRKGKAVLLQELREYAAKRRLSHGSLAKALGVSFVTLNQWLQGHRKLREDECQRIENLFKK